MTKHKHAELIKAKANNMELVVFMKSTEDGKWLKIIDFNVLPAFYDDYEHFLCHQKHEKECLHWLNGGKVDIYEGESEKIKWTPINLGVVWGEYHPFMNSSLIFRIKPRKEKRWIGVTKGGDSTMSFRDKRDAIDAVASPQDWQFIEIEVEV